MKLITVSFPIYLILCQSVFFIMGEFGFFHLEYKSNSNYNRMSNKTILRATTYIKFITCQVLIQMLSYINSSYIFNNSVRLVLLLTPFY